METTVLPLNYGLKLSRAEFFLVLIVDYCFDETGDDEVVHWNGEDFGEDDEVVDGGHVFAGEPVVDGLDVWKVHDNLELAGGYALIFHYCFDFCTCGS